LLGARGAAHADGAYHLAIDHDRHAALQGGEVVEGEHGGPPPADDLLEGAGGVLEDGRGPRLTDGDLTACRESAVEALEGEEISALIHHRKRSPYLVPARLGRRRRDHLLGALQREPALGGHALGVRRCRGQK
jgi:hypothetical protein